VIDAPAARQDLGHFFLLIDTSRLGSSSWLAERVDDFVGILHSTPPADAAKPVMVPGEMQMERFEQQRRHGIAMDEAVLEMLVRCARGS